METKHLHKIKDFTNTEGGEYLKDTTKEVVLNTIQQIINSYGEKSHSELIALCAKLSANVGLLQLLTGVDDQIKAIETLYEQEKEGREEVLG